MRSQRRRRRPRRGVNRNRHFPCRGAGPAFPLILLPRVPCPCPSVFWRDRVGIFFPTQAELWGDLHAASFRPFAKYAKRTRHGHGWWCQRKDGPDRALLRAVRRVRGGLRWSISGLGILSRDSRTWGHRDTHGHRWHDQTLAQI
jgi:hypothetical protein